MLNKRAFIHYSIFDILLVLAHFYFNSYFLFQRKDYDKCGAFVFLAMGGDNPAMLFNNLFGNGQTNAGSFVLLLGMQPLENREYYLSVLTIEADSIVLYR